MSNENLPSKKKQMKPPPRLREGLFAISGAPVFHSKSPLIYNTMFRGFARDALYVRLAAFSPIEVLFLCRKLGLRGLNITTPFKKSILPFLDTLDEASSAIGGVNIVIREKSRLHGFNTDYIGVTRSLKDRRIDIAGKRCLVLGAGSAGRAAIYGLVKENGQVTVINRTYEHAQQAARELGCKAEQMDNLQQLLKQADIFITAISAPVDFIPGEWLPPGLIVFDANYRVSPLSHRAEDRACRVIRGEEWLLNQAIPSFYHFFPAAAGYIFPTYILRSLKQAMRSPDIQQGYDMGGYNQLSQKPKNIALIGFMSSGKTVIGKKLAEKIGFQFIDTDHYVEEKAGISVPEIFIMEKEAGFRLREKAAITELLPNRKGVVFACGGGSVIDLDNLRLIKKNAAVIWLFSSTQTTLRRLRNDMGKRPLLHGDSMEQKVRELFGRRLSFYARGADIIVSSENDVDQVVEKIYAEINEAVVH